MDPFAEPVTLDSKYAAHRGRVLLTGVQALVRLPLMRSRLDRAAGLNTAGFISGYRGSPLGTYDSQLAAAKALLDAHDVVARPAINEDLAATAVWGTQQVGLYGRGRFDGVFGIWYGKAPGVDRTGDVFKHANMAGVDPRGGVLAVAGDDHGAKSSSLAAQSEYAFVDAEIPVFAPASVAEVLSFGLKAFDLSRYAGLWTAMVTVAEIMDSAASVDLDSFGYEPSSPRDVALPADGLHIRIPDTPLAQEVRHREFRLPAALAFVRANAIDRIVMSAARPRLGIVAVGKAYGVLRQAMSDLGVDEREAERLGLRLYKPGLVWPLEPLGARDFARGLEEILVVEERRDLVESQLKQICYGLPKPPRIVGKFDEAGRPLIAQSGEIDAGQVARALVGRLWGDQRSARMNAWLEQLEARPAPSPALHERRPYFCSGCPHNSSTVVPAGSRAVAGIGCHYLVQGMDRSTSTFTQMGGEGVSWVGQAPFSDEPHIFANLGDGTYFHSGVLAIRQAVAAGVNITYKILFNDAVAMTGGQSVDGELTVPALTRQLAAEGVRRIVVVTDDVERARATTGYAAGVDVFHRDQLATVQQSLREVKGVTALVYDQTCATELRRRRKRGLAPKPDFKLYINPRVCEGCGDCQAASNCVSIEPLETEFGRKRRIDQSSCNQDASCAKGFCPSFVTVRGAGPATRPVDLAALLADVPDPVVPPLAHSPRNIVLAGVGGQGVTSLSAVMAMAAHLDGGAANSVDMLGMAQKGGGVFVHLRLARSPDDIPAPRIGAGQADLILANDLIAAHGPTVSALGASDRTTVLLNEALTPTADFIRDNAISYDVAGMARRLHRHARAMLKIPAGRLAAEVLGDAIFSNMVLLGHAWQLGLVPLSLNAIERAIELNGAAVGLNRRAFALGRRLADKPAEVAAMLAPAPPAPGDFDTVLDRLADDLAGYQDDAYARRFRRAIAAVAEAETRVLPGSTRLSLAAARSLHRLMAYKDEYEVARLYADPAFQAEMARAFPGGRLSLNLAPPLLARKDPQTGLPRKREFGPWLLRLMPALARLKALRGTPLDPFGHTHERRQERALRDEFEGLLGDIARTLRADNVEATMRLVSLPMTVRGFGHVKAASVARYRDELTRLRALPAGGPASAAPIRELAL